MMKYRLIRSVYTRTIMQLTIAILIVFCVLGLVYYSVVSISNQRQQAGQLINAAQAISDVVAANLDQTGEIEDTQVISYINFTARSTGAVVWVVNYSGEVIMHTGIPGEVAAKLEVSDRGYYRLPAQYLAAMGSGTSGVSMSGDFNGLLAGTGFVWLSAAYPIPASTSGYNGEIQLHYPEQTRSLSSFLMTNGLIFSFLIAFIIAFLFNSILSRNITRPIRLLSDAADRVSRGDLSVRIILPGINDRAESAQHKVLVNDDLISLVNTMNSMIEKLEYQERDRKDFISSVSHDLRTPITSIRGFVEGMLDGTIPPDRFAHYLEIVKQEVLRLQTLVNTMFEGSVLESGRQINQTVFDINQVIKEDIIGLESLLADKKLDVQTDFLADEQGRLLAIGDREAISRVVYNITSNAIRFTPADGIIAFTTRRSARAKEIEVIIEDNGPGIPEQEYPYVFDRFYKVDKSRTAKGSGLGLYICRTILASHGQRISVSRSDLGGARFTFTLAIP
ncbi:MAG: HAMP domain-containing sensor histidine kinase [Clostridiaceae bacterium]|nr:HAMP domain-containing sensor histidine kinase [Clostridiaceae bacterium]